MKIMCHMLIDNLRTKKLISDFSISTIDSGDLLNNNTNSNTKEHQLNNANNLSKRQSNVNQLNGQTRCNNNLRASPSQLNHQLSSFHHQLAAAAAAGLSNGHPLLNNHLNLQTSNGQLQQLTSSMNSNSNSSTSSILKQQTSPQRDLTSPPDLYNQQFINQNEHRSRRCSSPNSPDRSNQLNCSTNSHNSVNSRGNSRERSDSEERDAKRRRTRTNFNGWQLEELEKVNNLIFFFLVFFLIF